ncbi:MAG: beta-ketoacyl synthase N-terminal-like domain-containing protein, partial [Candidatus Brocadiaceae bacterium]
AVVGMGGVFPTCSKIEDFDEKIFANASLIREWPEAIHYEKQLRSRVSGYIEPEEIGIKIKYSEILEHYPEIYLDTLNRIPYENLLTADLGSVFAMLATQEAVMHAQWKETDVQSETTGVIIGSGAGGQSVLRGMYKHFFDLGKKSRLLTSHNVDRTMVYRDAANVSCLIKSKGIVEGLGSACACGLGNIGYAYRLIKHGYLDRCVAGGTEGTSIETFVMFDAMQVLSRNFAPRESSRPFDKNRNGFVCSFGCGIVALEELESAKSRDANILAVIDGYFNNSDGSGNMFATSFEGQSRLLQGLHQDCMESNPRKFNNKPDVVKVHGTSTPVGDIVELMSVVNFYGHEGYHISAPKSQFGHMLGAAGAVEFIVAVLMLQQEKVSPCMNSFELSCELEDVQKVDTWKGPKIPPSEFRHLIPLETVEKDVTSVVCLNYGFGGTNAAIRISKYNEAHNGE